MTRPKLPTRLRIISWNVKVGRRPKTVARMVRLIGRLHRADIIVLQEAHGYIGELCNIPGWQLVVAPGRGEAQGTPILVRNGHVWRRRHSIRCHTPWTGPKAGRHHRGRVFTVAEVEGWTIVNVHRTRPGWSPNGSAFAEEADRLLDTAADTDGPLVILGDQNIGTRPGGDRARHTPFALARAIRAHVITTTAGHIDYALTRGITGHARRLRSRYGSDHNPVLFTLTAK